MDNATKIRRLTASLKETVAVLELHIADEASNHGLKHVCSVCPCWDNEVKRAHELLHELGEL